MAVLLPRRVPSSTAGADLTTYRAEASTDGPGHGEAVRPRHMSPALPSVTWWSVTRAAVVRAYGIADHVGKLSHAAPNGVGPSVS